MKLRNLMSILAIMFILLQMPLGVLGKTIRERKRQLCDQEMNLDQKDIESSVVVNKIENLKDYLRIGLKRNAGVQAAFYKWKASFDKMRQSFSLPDPVLSYTEYIESVETRVGPQEYAWTIKQTLPMADKLWKKRDKEFQVSEAAYYEFEQKRLELAYRITNAYYDYAYLAKAIELTNENMKLLQNFEGVVQVKYATGIAKNQDLLKTQVELGKLENELLSLKDSQSLIVARLNALLNLPADTSLPWPQDSLEGINEQQYQEGKDLIEKLKDNNLQLQVLLKNTESKKEAVGLAKRKYLPDLTVSVTHIETSEALNPATTDNGKDPTMLMFSINIPIWCNRLNAGIAESKAALKAAQQAHKDKEQELIARLARVHYQLRDAFRQSQLYDRALIPKAIQTLNATKSGYEAAKVDFLSLIDAQRVLLNFQLIYYRQNAYFLQRYAELQMLLGEQIFKFEN